MTRFRGGSGRAGAPGGGVPTARRGALARGRPSRPIPGEAPRRRSGRGPGGHVNQLDGITRRMRGAAGSPRLSECGGGGTPRSGLPPWRSRWPGGARPDEAVPGAQGQADLSAPRPARPEGQHARAWYRRGVRRRIGLLSLGRNGARRSRQEHPRWRQRPRRKPWRRNGARRSLRREHAVWLVQGVESCSSPQWSPPSGQRKHQCLPSRARMCRRRNGTGRQAAEAPPTALATIADYGTPQWSPPTNGGNTHQTSYP